MAARIKKIGLGTVQWGLDYGLSNLEGKTSAAEVALILSTAREAGISVLDTAALYGDAECQLGQQSLTGFRIVTKTPQFTTPTINTAAAISLVETFKSSLQQLNQASLYGLLVHDAGDLLAPGGERLIDAMLELQRSGLVSRIGVSVYESEQIKKLLERFTPDIIQLPLNVIDQRLIKDGSLARLQALGVEIHSRSALLQGLLLMPIETLPSYFRPWHRQLQAWHTAYKDQHMTPLQAALGFVCDQAEVSCCLIGVQNQKQLLECLSGLDAAPGFNACELACPDLNLVNPAKWSVA